MRVTSEETVPKQAKAKRRAATEFALRTNQLRINHLRVETNPQTSLMWLISLRNCSGSKLKLKLRLKHNNSLVAKANNNKLRR